MHNHLSVNKKIWLLAWPMIISNLSVPLLGLADTAMLGHLETPLYLAAVAVGSSILSFLYWGFGFLRMGTTGLAAQSFGANDTQHNRLILGQSICMALVLSGVILIASPLFIHLGLALIGAPEESRSAALSYCQIRIFSSPAVLVNYSIIGWLIGQQNTRGPLLITLFTNALNIILDYLFIIHLKMNSDGAAYATVIAEYIGCGLALFLLQKTLRQLPGSTNWARLKKWKDYQELVSVNRHLFLRTFMLLGCFAFFTAQGAQQGGVILAANTLIMQLMMMTSFGLDGFAHAAEALTGEAIGKRQHALFMSTCQQCGKWSILTAMMFSMIYALAGEQMLNLLSSIDTVVLEAGKYLGWLIALPMVALWSYLLDGIFIGASRSQAMQNTMIISAVMVYLPVWYTTQAWGNHGLWLAFIAFNGARGLTLAALFVHYSRQHRWC